MSEIGPRVAVNLEVRDEVIGNSRQIRIPHNHPLFSDCQVPIYHFTLCASVSGDAVPRWGASGL